MHTIKAEVDAEKTVPESNKTNNIDIMNTYVKSKPDLSVKILTPEADNKATDVKKAGMILGGLVLPMFIARKRWRAFFAVLIILLYPLADVLIMKSLRKTCSVFQSRSRL